MSRGWLLLAACAPLACAQAGGAPGFDARFVSTVGIYPCIGSRDPEGNKTLRDAFTKGGQDGVRSLRTDAHEIDPSCWLHQPGFCLSTLR